MRKSFDVPGLQALGRAAMIKTNGGAKGGQSALHSNAATALGDALTKGIADGNQHRYDSITKNIAKHPAAP